MPTIPANINGVAVEFKDTVGKDVEQRMIDGLEHCIKTNIASGYTLQKIYIYSANDSHTTPN